MIQSILNRIVDQICAAEQEVVTISDDEQVDEKKHLPDCKEDNLPVNLPSCSTASEQ